MRPEVSVIIPTRDRPSFLASSLRAALAQQDVDLEVIVVDDGSTVDISSVVGACSDRRVRCCRHLSPRGICAARNTGVARSRGIWVAFLDDDDLWAPDKLSVQISGLNGQLSAQWSCTGAATVDSQLRIVARCTPPKTGKLQPRIRRNNLIVGGPSSVVVRRSLLDRVGYFDPFFRQCGDWDMWIRLAEHSPIYTAERPLTAYVLHATNMTVDVEGCLREFEPLFAKHPLSPGQEAEFEWSAWANDAIATHLRVGRRWTAARLLLLLARRERRWRHLRRAAAALVAPNPAEIARRRARKAIPEPWLREAEAWLEPFRRAAA